MATIINADVRTDEYNRTGVSDPTVSAAAPAPNAGTTSIFNEENKGDNAEKIKQLKNESIQKLVKDLKGISEQQVYDYFNKAFGDSKDVVTNEMGMEEFNEKLNLIKTALESLINRNKKCGKAVSDEQISKCANMVNKAIKENGHSITETQKLIARFETMTLLDYLKEKSQNKDSIKNYNSIAEIPDEELKTELKTLITELLNKEDITDPKKAEKRIQFFRDLLDRCSDEDKIKLFNVFVEEIAHDNDIKALFKSLVNKVEDKSKLQEVIQKLNFPLILEKIQFNPDATETILLEAINAMGVKSEPEQIKSQIGWVIDLLQNTAKRRNEILSKPEEQRTEEQKEYLKNIDACLASIGAAGMAGMTAKGYSKTDIAPLIDTSKELNVYENTMYAYSKIAEKHGDLLNISQDELNKAMEEYTSGEYTNILKEYKAPQEIQDSSSSSCGIGFGQKVGLESVALINGKVNELYNTIKATSTEKDDNKIEIVKENSPVTNTMSVGFKTYTNLSGFSANDLHEGIKTGHIKLEDAFKEYKHLNQSGKDYVDKALEIMLPAYQNRMLDKVPNSVAIIMIKRTKIDPSKLNIALDYANQKELERMQKEKANAN